MHAVHLSYYLFFEVPCWKSHAHLDKLIENESGTLSWQKQSPARHHFANNRLVVWLLLNPRSGNGFSGRTLVAPTFRFFCGGGRCWLVQSLCIIGADTLVSDNSDLCRPGNFAGLISFSLGLKRGWQIVQEINFGIGSMSCWVRKRSNSHLGNEKAATPTIRALLSSVWTFFGGWALGLCEL